MKSYDHYWTSTLLWKKSLLISRNADNSNVNGQHRDSQLTREQYVHQSNVVNNLMKSLKLQHYSSIIKENFGNKKSFVQKYSEAPSENDLMLAHEFAAFLLLRQVHYIMISLLKRRFLLIRPNVLLMRYSLCLGLNFQLSLRWNLMTSGNWLQHYSRSPVSWVHYHLPLSNNVQTYCCLLLVTSSTSPFAKAACLRVWNLQ